MHVRSSYTYNPPKVIVSRSHSGEVKKFIQDAFGNNTTIITAGGAGELRLFFFYCSLLYGIWFNQNNEATNTVNVLKEKKKLESFILIWYEANFFSIIYVLKVYILMMYFSAVFIHALVVSLQDTRSCHCWTSLQVNLTPWIKQTFMSTLPLLRNGISVQALRCSMH